MNKKNSCPLDGSWAQEHCSSHSENIQNDSISACTHKSKCEELRKILESDLDSSITTTKKILHKGIPKIFD
ncbi:MAG: hypothetical protein ACOYN1_05170 [Polynucleobacter sp.]